MSQQADEAAEWTDEPVHSGRAAGQAESTGRAAELAELLASRRAEHHLVALQDFPDPDAISSGMAYREIARQFGIEADVMYDGRISHPENLALVNLLGIDLCRYQEGMELDGYDAAVFVDNQGTTTHLTERLKAAGVPTLVVIDHHEGQDLLDPVFADIRPVAAAATLLTEYLRSGKILRLDPENPAHVQLATALMHGLHSETDGFIHAREAEYHAAAYLSRFIDDDLLHRVLCVEKSHATMESIEAALARRVVRGGYSVAGVGFLRWADRDAIPQACDFLLTEENVHTVVVYGILIGDEDREVVSGSLRTSKLTLSVDGFLKDALGADDRGQFYGGGRSRAGGFEIDLGFLAGDDDRETRQLKWELFDRRIRQKLFEAAGVEEDDEGTGE
ncbi:MAG: bifunctional oligoribonuclease/PAP phosphatase NrnA [Gemmatimonadota bacterium]|nr:bifunctional oligoribonuclease/PAP phosphatase NrnA [Gemmatimonadota bacterium]